MHISLTRYYEYITKPNTSLNKPKKLPDLKTILTYHKKITCSVKVKKQYKKTPYLTKRYKTLYLTCQRYFTKPRDHSWHFIKSKIINKWAGTTQHRDISARLSRKSAITYSLWNFLFQALVCVCVCVWVCVCLCMFVCGCILAVFQKLPPTGQSCCWR